MVKRLDWHIASDNLTVTIWAFMSCSKPFKNLHWDTAMPDNRRLHENVLIRNHEGISQCCTENFWMYSITLTANRLVSETIFLTSTLHQAGKVMTWEVQGPVCRGFFSSRKHSVPKQKMTKLLTWQRLPVWKTLHCYREIAAGIFCNCVYIEGYIHTKIQCLINTKQV